MAKTFSGLGTTAGLAADRAALTGMSAGQQFFETDTKKYYVYNGSSWIQQNDYTTTAMTIDSTGRVLLPYQPRFYIVTSAFTFTSTATTTVPFNTAFVNNGSYFNTSTYTFTAPIAGTYVFAIGFQKRFTGALQTYWNKNGTQSRCLYVDLAGDSPHPTSTIMYNLAANDTLKIDYNLSAGDIYGGSGTEPFTYFMGHMIG